jgi:gas vesicle protein GvpA/GvpJ/GvpM family
MSARRPRLTTMPAGKPPKRTRMPYTRPSLPKSAPRPRTARRDVAHIIDQSEHSLVDVIDNLLNRGVVLRADLILALADVDLVYVQLSALLCAADRVLPPRRTS